MNAIKNDGRGRAYEAQADRHTFSHCGCVAGRNANGRCAITVFISVVRHLGRGRFRRRDVLLLQDLAAVLGMSGVGGNCIERTYSHAQPTRLVRNHHGLARTVRVNAPERPSLAPPVTAAVADEPPKLDVTTPCNAAAQFALLAGRDKDACVNDERTAETTLTENWSKYAADDKNQCVGTVQTGGPSSYVELLSCIEVLQDAKQIREGDPLMRSDRPVESAPQLIPARRR
jgi:hypothetical protein